MQSRPLITWINCYLLRLIVLYSSEICILSIYSTNAIDENITVVYILLLQIVNYKPCFIHHPRSSIIIFAFKIRLYLPYRSTSLLKQIKKSDVKFIQVFLRWSRWKSLRTYICLYVLKNIDYRLFSGAVSFLKNDVYRSHVRVTRTSFY